MDVLHWFCFQQMVSYLIIDLVSNYLYPLLGFSQPICVTSAAALPWVPYHHSRDIDQFARTATS